MNLSGKSTTRRLLALAFTVFFCKSAQASTLISPREMIHELLSESVPTAFAPMEITEDDFEFEWDGQSLDGVRFFLEPGSIQWSRVSEILVLPRARLRIEAEKIQGGRISYMDFTNPLSAPNAPSAEARKNRGTGAMPVALISGSDNPVDLFIVRDGKELHGRIIPRFRPKSRSKTSTEEPRVFRDPSCSRFGLQVGTSNGLPIRLKAQQWVYIGCRSVVSGTGASRTATLELYVFWDNVGREIQLEGSWTPSSAVSIWAMKVTSDPGVLGLRAGGQELQLRYFLPDRLHFFNLGMGIGPYGYEFKALEEPLGGVVSDYRPLVTLYASYFFSETIRIVGFNALAIGKSGFNDLGIYFNSENFRIVDRRLSLNLLLGGHVIGFQTKDNTYLIPGAPQGLEMIYVDFLQKGANLSLGGFVYPKINDKAYYNLWMRWGSSALFGEVNFILWEEKLYDRRVYSRSLGVSLGFPLARLF
jgi:hypothetical protein